MGELGIDLGNFGVWHIVIIVGIVIGYFVITSKRRG